MSSLDQLQPLIAPPSIGFWPPAPGWWLLLLVIPLLGWGLWWLRRFLPKRQPVARAEQPLDPLRIAALAELALMPKPYDGAPAGAWLQQLNGLLKRLCRNDYPYSQSHTLNGRKWLAFLDNRCPAAGLTRWMVLVEGAYKPECKLDDKAIAGLTQAVDTWIANMFEFAWPWIFALLPLPWLMRLVLPVADSGEPALKVSYLADLEGLARRRARANLPGWRQQAPFVVLWLLLLTAAARPEWLGEPLPIAASGRDLLVAVDVSGSMDFPDMHWQDDDVSRLSLVQHLLGDFLESREGDRVGLILFGSQAYLQAPLTFDRRTVRTWLDEARIGIAGKNTAIGDAIGLALKRLRQRPAQSRVLILVTDGANNAGQIDPLTAARLAAEEGVKIYPIGIGADPEQTGSLGILGVNPSLDLDEPALKAIADATGGRYFRARDGDELQQIRETLDQLEPVAQQPTQARPAQALYSAPLALALLLSMLLVIQERWPNNALQRAFNKLTSKGIFLQQHPEWRQRLKRLRLRRRR